MPPTPNNELANSLKVIAESEADAAVHFKMVEKGGSALSQFYRGQTPWRHLAVMMRIVSPVNLAGGQGDSVKGVE